ncbi:hypothetical protein C8N32_11011 [Rhodovulum imhoffii]|uniref:Uncharacterized protein n=1 Tax=Rhodovulum imhoffii TaxID=365340 RepID=A0A2T5BR47_9RHOB|nr:hypothetical protein [Rhodovulum imhoffii]MBK5934385.1 hypothetical protein [Rhodovulum imhoffii]PTN01730.1 hypothetical protein C8N32_11011 [Rhodovulum imhoffii]
MPDGVKIATCCYCGTRAALVLRGGDRHELSCSACGAPLRQMKVLPRKTAPEPRQKTLARADFVSRKARKVRRKPRKGRLRWLMEEAFDVVEDIFD